MPKFEANKVKNIRRQHALAEVASAAWVPAPDLQHVPKLTGAPPTALSQSHYTICTVPLKMGWPKKCVIFHWMQRKDGKSWKGARLASKIL